MSICKNCQKNFAVTDRDKRFLQRMKVPEPTHCPDCRQQRRLSYRNERKFYKRKCDFSGKEIVSVYSPDKNCVVYAQEIWWGDKWDPFKYGQDFDFDKSFFEQFLELSQKVPRLPLINFDSENSFYTNHSGYNKNCYMCINTANSEDCYYTSNLSIHNKNCVDCLAIQKCELCYFCVDSQDCSYSQYLDECRGCLDSMFCFDCHSCNNCFGCFNLRNKQYHIFNKSYSREEYQKKIEELKPQTWEKAMELLKMFRQSVHDQAIHKFARIENCENCSGDHLMNDKNVAASFYTSGSEDCAYNYDSADVKDAWDATEPYLGQIQYETQACNNAYNAIGLSKCYDCKDSFYSQYCWNGTNIFGCFGLRHKQYCIFNKQYTKEEYEKVVEKIIERMKKDGQWGEFFPIENSAFGYNETVSQEYFPLTKEEALKKNYHWQDEIEETQETHGNSPICSLCRKQFLIVPAEIEFYKKQKLPLPETCSQCRHTMRFAFRPPRKLLARECGQCKKLLKTCYTEKDAKKILCEECYLKALY